MKRLGLIFLILLLSASFSYGAVEDPSAYTSSGNATITTSSTTVTVTSGQATGYLYTRKGNDYYTGWYREIKTKITAADDGAKWCISGYVDTIGEIDSESSQLGVILYWERSGSDYRLVLEDIGGNTDNSGSNLSISTDYYVIFRRAGQNAKALIYSDSTFSTLVDTLTIDGITDSFATPYSLISAAFKPAYTTLKTWAELFTDATNDGQIYGVYGITGASGNSKTYCDQMKIVGGSTTYLDDKFDGIGSWVEAGDDTGSTGQVAFEGRGCIWADPDNSSNNIRLNQTLASGLPDAYTVTWTEYYEDLGNAASANSSYKLIRNGVDRVFLKIFTDEIQSQIADSSMDSHTVATSADNWYEHEIDVDSTANAGDGELVLKRRDLEALSISCEVSNIEDTVIAVDNYYHLGRFITGSIEGEFTAADLAPWTVTNNTGDPDIAARSVFSSGVWPPGGDIYSAHLKGSGNLKQTFAKGSEDRFAVATWAWVVAISDGHLCELISVRDEAESDIRGIVSMYRNGTEYFWAYSHYDGAAWDTEISTYQASVATAYYVQLVYEAGKGLAVMVDGVNVINYDDDGDWTGNEVDYVYLGRWTAPTGYSTDSERYIDAYHFQKERHPTHTGLDRISNGKIVAGVRFSSIHGWDADSIFYVMLSDDEMVTWSTHQTLDIDSDIGADEDGRCQQSVTAVGDNVYIFIKVRDDSARGVAGVSPGQLWKTYVYKATVTAGSLGQFTIVGGGSPEILADYNFQVGYVEGTLIYGTGFQFDWSDYAGDSKLNGKVVVLTYNTSTDTFLTSGSHVTLETEDATHFANETALFKRPSDGKVVAITRWDDISGNSIATPFPTYKVCSDDPLTAGHWGSQNDLTASWGIKTGSVAIRLIGDKLYAVGRASDWEVAGVWNRPQSNWIGQINGDTLEIINESRLGFGPRFNTANGDSMAFLSSGGNKLLMMLNSGDVACYVISLGSPDDSNAAALMIGY